MKNSQSILIAVVVTAIIVGGGMYLWQASVGNKPIQIQTQLTQTAAKPQVEAVGTAAKVVLYSDIANKFNFVTNNGCEKYLKITKSVEGAKTGFSVSIPLAKQWNGDLMYYQVMSQTEYNGIPTDELPGKPTIGLVLSNGSLLTGSGSQDWPSESDLPAGCNVEAVNIQ
jgi:hypothetical protein